MILNLSNGKYKTSIPVDQYSRDVKQNTYRKKELSYNCSAKLNRLKVNYLNTLDMQF